MGTKPNPPVQPDPNNPSPFPAPPPPAPAVPKANNGLLLQTIFDGLRSLWLSVRGNPFFVAFEGGATGAIFDFIDDGISSGHLDFSHAGLHKLATVALIGGVASVRLLYRPAPKTNPK